MLVAAGNVPAQSRLLFQVADEMSAKLPIARSYISGWVQSFVK